MVVTAAHDAAPNAGGAARIINTINYQTVGHPALPTAVKKLTLDTSIEERRNLEIYPEPGSLIDKAPILFVVDHTPEFLLDMSQLALDIVLTTKKLKVGEGAAARDAMPAFFTNNLISSLFTTAKVEINSHVVEANYNLPITARLEHILTTSDELTEECGFVTGTFPISGDCPTNTFPDALLARATTV